MIRAIIIDNEPHGRIVLQQMIQRFCGNVEITAITGNMTVGKKIIQDHHPDVVFLDADTSVQNGIELQEIIGKENCNVVVVSVDEFYKSITEKKSGAQFLLKPYNPVDLKSAIEKIKL